MYQNHGYNMQTFGRNPEAYSLCRAVQSVTHHTCLEMPTVPILAEPERHNSRD